MNDALRDALAVEVGHLFKKQDVFKNDWSAHPHGERILIVSDGSARVRRHFLMHF
jgi:hypothetical protein